MKNKKSDKELFFERFNKVAGIALNEESMPMKEAGKANQFKVNIGGDSFTITGEYIEVLNKVFNKAKEKIKSSDVTIKNISIKPIGFANTNEGDSSIEDVAAAADDINDYEEAPSYQIKLDKISQCAADLHEKFKELDDLPAWVQDKITIAEHNMVAVNDWLESKAHDAKYHQDSGEEIEDDDQEQEMDTDDVKINNDDLEALK